MKHFLLIMAMLVSVIHAAPPAFSDQILASPGLEKPIGKTEPLLTNTLTLRGSRGEVLNFILKADVNGCQPLQLSAFTSAAGAAAVSIEFYRMHTIRTRRPSFPGAYVGLHYDPLIPDSVSTVCGSAGESFWRVGELRIPRDAQPGTYRATLTLGAAALPVTLRVWKMTMPEAPALPAYAELTTWFNLLGHYGEWVDQEPELALKYVAAMNDHRIYPVKSGIDMPAMQERNGKPVLDLWNSPDARQAFYPVTLSQRPSWAYYDFPTLFPADVGTPFMQRYFRAVQNTIPLIERPGKPFVYLWDEPPPDQFPLLRRFASSVKRLAPDLKVMVTTQLSKRLSRSIDIFCPIMNEFGAPGFPSPARYRAAQRRGKEVWWYVACPSHGCSGAEDPGTPDFVIDRPSSYIRSTAWISAKYHIDAFLYYSVNNGYQFYPRRDPWKSLWDFTGNGDGTLFYPGRPGERGLTDHVPVPSIRLKLWRESSYDAEYVRWIEQAAPEWWAAAFEGLVQSQTQWNRDYGAFREMRDRMGEFLDANRS